MSSLGQSGDRGEVPASKTHSLDKVTEADMQKVASDIHVQTTEIHNVLNRVDSEVKQTVCTEITELVSAAAKRDLSANPSLSERHFLASDLLSKLQASYEIIESEIDYHQKSVNSEELISKIKDVFSNSSESIADTSLPEIDREQVVNEESELEIIEPVIDKELEPVLDSHVVDTGDNSFGSSIDSSNASMVVEVSPESDFTPFETAMMPDFRDTVEPEPAPEPEPEPLEECSASPLDSGRYDCDLASKMSIATPDEVAFQNYATDEEVLELFRLNGITPENEAGTIYKNGVMTLSEQVKQGALTKEEGAKTLQSVKDMIRLTLTLYGGEIDGVKLSPILLTERLKEALNLVFENKAPQLTYHIEPGREEKYVDTISNIQFSKPASASELVDLLKVTKVNRLDIEKHINQYFQSAEGKRQQLSTLGKFENENKFAKEYLDRKNLFYDQLRLFLAYPAMVESSEDKNLLQYLKDMTAEQLAI